MDNDLTYFLYELDLFHRNMLLHVICINITLFLTIWRFMSLNNETYTLEISHISASNVRSLLHWKLLLFLALTMAFFSSDNDAQYFCTCSYTVLGIFSLPDILQAFMGVWSYIYLNLLDVHLFSPLLSTKAFKWKYKIVRIFYINLAYMIL